MPRAPIHFSPKFSASELTRRYEMMRGTRARLVIFYKPCAITPNRRLAKRGLADPDELSPASKVYSYTLEGLLIGP